MEDALTTIFNFLHYDDIMTCSLINKRFHAITTLPIIWKHLLLNKYKTDAYCYEKSYYETYKSYFKLSIFMKKYGLDCKSGFNIDHIDSFYKIQFELPQEIYLLSNLKLLNLCRNHIHIIPTEIGRLKNLTFLSVSINSITFLPTELGEITNLESFYFYRNAIKEIPTEIGKLQN
jgi:hypothetical protein